MKISNGEADAEQYNTRNPNIYKFYTEILSEPIFNTDSIPKKILCIAHSSLIRKIWQDKDPNSYDKNREQLRHMLNTGVFQEIINYDNSTFNEVYEPSKIRWQYENFEDLNIDICRTESVKGIINFNLKEPAETYIGSFARNLKGYLARETIPQERLSYDVAFYDQNNYINKSLPTELIGGTDYYLKYLKYKSKYLLLKQNKLNY
jgi:hypothetical protein